MIRSSPAKSSQIRIFGPDGIVKHLKSAGYAAEFIQKFLGHQSIQTTTDIYGTLSLGEMQQMIAQKTGDTSLIGDANCARAELPRPPERR